jgi:Berberine and berberine like
VVLAWSGDLDAGEKAIAPLREVAPTIAQGVRPIPYVALQGMLDGGAPHGRHYYWKSHRFDTFPDELIDIFAARVESVTAPFWQLNGWAVGGAASRVDPTETAVGHREVGFDLNVVAAWPPPDPAADKNIAWVREGWAQMAPYADGVYANFISDEGRTGVEAAYGERLARLTALKDRYDPTNFFRLNANIPPSREKQA